MGYFMWRIMTGQSEKIEILMQTPGANKYFRFVSEEPGVVTARSGRDAPEQKIYILKTPGYIFLSRDRPTTMMPGSLPQELPRYLMNTVRPYIRTAVQDK